MMDYEFRQNLVGEAARDVLRYLRVGWIPPFGFRFDGQFDCWLARTSNLLQSADIDFGNNLQPPLGRFLNILPKQIPMVGQWHYCRTADGNVSSDKKAW